MDKNWFRNTTWNEETEKHFFAKLNRVRDKAMQAQYLNLQAGSLTYTKDGALMKVAEMLINKQLQEYSDITMYVSRAFSLLGDIYGFGRDYDKAIDCYKQAIDFEAKFPQFISGADSAYAELAIKIGRTDLYDEVEKVLSETRYRDELFPISKYLKYSILSIISKHKCDAEKAEYYANLAEENAAMQQSGLNRHKTLGLVKERDRLLDKLMYE